MDSNKEKMTLEKILETKSSPSKRNRFSVSSMSRNSIKKRKKEEEKEILKTPLEIIKEILNKDKNQRSKQEIKIVNNILCEKIDYFKKLKDDGKNAKSEKIVSVLNLEKYQPNQYIMKYGEDGDKFYIVLQGKVALYKPIYNRKEMTLKQFSDLIYEIKFNEVDMLKYNRLIEKNSHLNLDIDLLFKLDPNASSLKQKLFFFIEEDQLLGTFNDGFPFGEIALIKHCKRSASVKALEDTYCITLTKNDYNKIMRELEERRLEKSLNTFRKSYPFFYNWISKIMIKLFNGFSTVKLSRGEFLCKQNENCEYIYIINSGTYEIYSMISFIWVQDFYTYIINAKDNIIKKMIDNKLKENDLRKLYDTLLLNSKKSPCYFNPYQIKNFIISNKKEINLNDLKKEEETILNNNNLFKVNVRKIDYKDMIGYEDALEFKKRFYYVKCISDYGEVQKISVFDFIKVMNYTDKKEKEKLLDMIADKKNFFYKQIYNSTKKAENRVENYVSYKYDRFLFENEPKGLNETNYNRFKSFTNGLKKFSQTRTNSTDFYNKNKPFLTLPKSENFPYLDINKKNSNIKRERELITEYKNHKKHYSTINKGSSQINQYHTLSKNFTNNENLNSVNSNIKYNGNKTNISVTIPVNKPLNRNDLSTLITYKKDKNMNSPIHSIKILRDFSPNSNTFNQDILFFKKLKLMGKTNGKKNNKTNIISYSINTDFSDDNLYRKNNGSDKYSSFRGTMYSKKFYLDSNFKTIYDEQTQENKKRKNMFSNLNIMLNSKI